MRHSIKTYRKALYADWLWYSRAPFRWYWKAFIWYRIRFGTDRDRKTIRHARVWGMGDQHLVTLLKDETPDA